MIAGIELRWLTHSVVRADGPHIVTADNIASAVTLTPPYRGLSEFRIQLIEDARNQEGAERYG